MRWLPERDDFFAVLLGSRVLKVLVVPKSLNLNPFVLIKGRPLPKAFYKIISVRLPFMSLYDLPRVLTLFLSIRVVFDLRSVIICSDAL
jgi:hypothetical protein